MTSRPLVSRDFRRWRTTIARCLLLAWTLLLWSPCLVGLAAPVTDDQKDLAQVSDLDYPKDRWLTDEVSVIDISVWKSIQGININKHIISYIPYLSYRQNKEHRIITLILKVCCHLYTTMPQIRKAENFDEFYKLDTIF